MKSIELSTMMPFNALFLDGLEGQYMLHPVHRQFDWPSAWNSVLQVALYQKGPDVSEVGSTWMENLSEMNALRPFSAADQRALGGMNSFLSTALAPDSPLLEHVVSIPWTLDTRMIMFRRDAMAIAGVSEWEAFNTPGALYETLARLQAAGYPYPLAMPTGNFSLHILSSFIWGRGCDFRSTDNRKLTLVEPEARRAMIDYFRLHRFIDPKLRQHTYADSDQLYHQGDAQVLFSGQWAVQAIKEGSRGGLGQVKDTVSEQSGFALPPGVPYVGGTHLVVWRHTLHDQEAIQLIAYLTDPSNLRKIAPAAYVFPARAETLNGAPYAGDPDYQLVGECLRRGRGLRSGKMWAAVESRLSAFFEQIWNDLFDKPDMDLEVEIERRTVELANRLERTLLAG